MSPIIVGHLIVLSVPGDVAYFMTSINCKFSENDVVPPQAPKSRNASQLYDYEQKGCKDQELKQSEP